MERESPVQGADSVHALGARWADSYSCAMHLLDRCLNSLGRGLRSLSGSAQATRPNPAADLTADLSDAERQHAARLMRVNHCGEVCAQGLYEGQALTARREQVRLALAKAAREEEDHLAWCRQRLEELDARPSILDSAFYAASFALGTATGLLGDRLSLGFVEATEDRVRSHLDNHLAQLPSGDARSRAILEVMRADEVRHGEDAVRAGGVRYSPAIKAAMSLASKVMTVTTARL